MKSSNYLKDYITESTSENAPLGKKSAFFAAVCTVILWILLTITFAVVKPVSKKPKYKTVQIVLSPEPVKKAETKKTETKENTVQSQTAKSTETVKEEPKVQKTPETKKTTQTASKPVSQNTKAAAKPKTENTKEAKTPVQKTAETPKAAAPKLAKSVEDQMNEAFSSTKKSAASDKAFDAMFADDDFGDTPSDTKKVASASKVSGTAGSSAASSSNSGISSSSSNSQDYSDQVTSEETKKMLSEISSPHIYSSKNNGVSSALEVTSASSNGKVHVKMESGRTRALLEPEKPVITLSSESAKLIDASKNVQITFYVEKDGHVPYSNISFTPESTLPSGVREEIRNQISKWRFERDNEKSVAIFDYTITVANKN